MRAEWSFFCPKCWKSVEIAGNYICYMDRQKGCPANEILRLRAKERREEAKNET